MKTSPPRRKWVTCTLGELGTYTNGKAFKPAQWGNVGLPIIRIQNLTNPELPFNYFNGDMEARYLVNDGDLLISWSATLGSYLWNRGPAVLNQHIFKVDIDREAVDKEFLHFLIQNTLGEMGDQTHGSTMKHITKGKFEALIVRIPPLDEQRRIVGRIKELLARVDEIRNLREEAVKEVQAVEGAIFADYVEEVMANDDIPETTLGDVLIRAQYGTSTKANVECKGTPIFRMGNIVDWHLDTSDIKHVVLPRKELEKYLLAPGDILFNRTNSLELVGKSAVFSRLQGDWTFASYLVRLEIDSTLALPEYVNAIINSRIGREFVHATANRAIGMVNINAQKIRRLRFPLPSLSVQRSLVDRMSEARASGDQLIKQLDTKAILRLPQAILRKAFAGEL